MQARSSEGIIPHRPALFRALGNSDFPDRVEIGGHPCKLARVLKHDSWGASALYTIDDGAGIVCKFIRVRPVLFFRSGGLGHDGNP